MRPPPWDQQVVLEPTSPIRFLIPLGGAHLRRVLKEWGRRSNRGHPHARLGPEIPDPPAGLLVPPIIDH